MIHLLTMQKYFYNRSYMMDRNLGARAAYGVSAECGGHLYQYGRKDPFQPDGLL